MLSNRIVIKYIFILLKNTIFKFYQKIIFNTQEIFILNKVYIE
jgi:hypothetical protein